MPEESSQLVDLLKKIINPCDRSRELPHIEIARHTFCLTGSFDHGPKDEIERAIGESGGTVLKGVSKKCDYVIVGGQGSEAWTTKNYGTKVKRLSTFRPKETILSSQEKPTFLSGRIRDQRPRRGIKASQRIGVPLAKALPLLP